MLTMKSLFGIVLLVVLVEGSSKKGVVHWADSYMCDDFEILNNMTWWFDFRMSLDYFHEKNICKSSIDNYKHNYVPMVWGYWSDTKIFIDDAAEFVLGFNEPNHVEQSNMSPEKAAAAWKEVEKHSKGKPLVSPSAAVCGKNCRSTEIEWFDKFFELCKDCRVDYLATHTYWCNANKTMTYLESLFKRYGRKIWLTEFACGESPYELEQLNYMKDMLPRLEAADYIYRYAWYRARLTKSGFITTAASLLKKDRSELTELGRLYNNYQGETSTYHNKVNIYFGNSVYQRQEYIA
ncbi:uncharacterized protein LOC132758271 [Ruditapes philippinarum]|uniref:uncharacterized protein LOC132758271 n=1 Tax=Ruditapes philippinarum TaxID=129788 RepID=UPI00295BF9FF|nr:uncharacterized protein LOC132758271 [Ruditapes philippinarum]